jgi:hypothetical protein
MGATSSIGAEIGIDGAGTGTARRGAVRGSSGTGLGAAAAAGGGGGGDEGGAGDTNTNSSLGASGNRSVA